MKSVLHKTHCAMLLLLLLPALSYAEGQYYLVARVAPEGSLTAPGQSRQVVYLRWDAIEGRLPADVQFLRLTRNGVDLFEQPVNAVMSTAEIAALYSGPAQQRRLLETYLKLQADAVSAGDDIAVSDMPVAIRQRIDPLILDDDRGWAYLASRSDINIARARYRAYVDDPGVGEFTYELLAVDAGGQTARLGLATINTAIPQQTLAATDFRQVPTSQCDLPESAKDHYSVAIHWYSAGAANITDRIAAQSYISGYDIYRTTSNLDAQVTVAPARNIAAEAAAAEHDSRGVPRLSGLELVNDTLLTITSDSTLAPEWLETQDELARAGLKPGDKRAYYLVPRDFTGNYGPTAAAIIVVPNLLRPPAPWDLRPVIDNVSPGLPGGVNPSIGGASVTLSWDAVDLPNYLDAYQDGRTFCNLATVADDGFLAFVGRGESCEIDTHRRVRLDVSDYLVYRFPDFESANRFKDSDGDGHSDKIEREREHLSQCNAGVHPPGSPEYLAGPSFARLSEFVLPQSGRRTYRLQDKVPALPSEQNTVYWYRVASKTPDGIVSHLSAPQRAIYPNRDLPPKPVLDLSQPGFVRNGCELVVDDPTGSWQLADQVDGSAFDVSCPNLKDPVTLTAKSSGINGAACQAIRSNCDTANNGNITLTYPSAAAGPALCEINLPADLPAEDGNFRFCSLGQARLVPTFEAGQVPVDDGDTSTGELTATVSVPPGAPEGSCVDLMVSIDGDYSREATSCGTPTPGLLTHDIPSGFFCGYAVTRDANNNVSPASVAPCAAIGTASAKLPTTPQPVGFSVGSNSADFSWRLPIEPVAVTLVSLEHTGSGVSDRELISVPSAGSGSGEVIDHIVAVPALSGDSDEFCVRFQALAPSTAANEAPRSGWSAPRCVTRRASGSDVPTYLPWPMVESAVEGPPLVVGLQPILGASSGNGLLFVELAPQLDEKLLVTPCARIPGTSPPGQLFFFTLQCNRAGMLAAQASVSTAVPLLMYRQARDASGNTGDWIQVSPLIEFAHFDAVTADIEGRDRLLNDPFVFLRTSTGPQGTQHRFVFVDRYPYRVGEYRYQAVYFDEDHRITRWRRSDWISFAVGNP